MTNRCFGRVSIEFVLPVDFKKPTESDGFMGGVGWVDLTRLRITIEDSAPWNWSAVPITKLRSLKAWCISSFYKRLNY
jgi:hypothetical protein